MRKVLLEVIDDEFLRFAVVRPYSKVDGLVIVQDSDFRLFGGLLALIGLSLDKIGGGNGVHPDRLIQDTVHSNGIIDVLGKDFPTQGLLGIDDRLSPQRGVAQQYRCTDLSYSTNFQSTHMTPDLSSTAESSQSINFPA